LQQGQSICLFPGRTNNYNELNEGLQQLGDIHIEKMDTAVQTAASLQQGSDLVKDLFEQLPGNVQLPQANWHYIIRAGLSANQQSVLSFRNGDPFLAKYTPAKGQLYICATSADLQSGNFPGSYFFVPFLYQMAVQSRGGDVYALTTGSAQAAYLPLANADERNMVHLYGKGLDVIPAQRPSGAGLDVFAAQAVKNAGLPIEPFAIHDSAILAHAVCGKTACFSHAQGEVDVGRTGPRYPVGFWLRIPFFILEQNIFIISHFMLLHPESINENFCNRTLIHLMSCFFARASH